MDVRLVIDNEQRSVATGRWFERRNPVSDAVVTRAAAANVGGMAPFEMLDDADLDAAVNAAAFGSFLFQGKICMSTERFMVDETIADKFVAKFVVKVDGLSAGDPVSNPACVVGPLVDAHSGTRINALVEDALAKGATLAIGGKAEGAIMPATIVDHVKPGMAIYDVETFGPITTIVRVSVVVEEAVRVANDTENGLSSAAHGCEMTRALAVAGAIDAGCVHINVATVQNEPQAPYGGIKQSGYGRFDGHAVIDEFTELKW